ncbi:transcriptional regulator NrdR [Gordonibacter sp.]|uniref:transcriptional regulator NrdR n=1 Tax=Gordonibacter sp. TaxID=1968902 RepID=UPI001F88FADD|nr:transcriptional regulator NrdR [Gordonibacter sp.]HIW75209.1 transcriptional regulator NrdR [Candidatus Gordonibacter avicola]
MRCPSCGNIESKVVDSRPSEDGTAIRRRRECLDCGRRFTTYERLGDNPLIVIKTDGSSEAYDRQKLMRGLLTACAKRPISPEQIASLIDSIETELRNASRNEIRSKELGDMALARLAKLDDVAYVRFASVYKDFQNVEEFASALEGLRS